MYKTVDKQKSDKAKALLAELFGDTVVEQTPSDEDPLPRGTG
ncbi:hypothetical protein [uncultured Paraglaciecola sp.]|nr:hypothetical protein [uncultured Paraglaciecola sp.]